MTTTWPDLPDRRPDWAEQLQRCVAQRLLLPFEWGRLDCALFAADCVYACTGVDPAAALRARYTSVRSARRYIARMGGLPAIALAALRGEQQPAAARAGDVGLVLLAGQELLAVCTGTAWLAPSRIGLQVVPVPVRAWKV